MGIHPKDLTRDNPRMQCVVCGKWKRMICKNKVTGEDEQVFFGACDYAIESHVYSDTHLAAKDGDDYVCHPCCKTACAALAKNKPQGDE